MVKNLLKFVITGENKIDTEFVVTCIVITLLSKFTFQDLTPLLVFSTVSINGTTNVARNAITKRIILISFFKFPILFLTQFSVQDNQVFLDSFQLGR